MNKNYYNCKKHLLHRWAKKKTSILTMMKMRTIMKKMKMINLIMLEEVVSSTTFNSLFLDGTKIKTQIRSKKIIKKRKRKNENYN